MAASFELPVTRVGGLAWTDGALAMLCRRPLEIGGSALKIARFSLPSSGRRVRDDPVTPAAVRGKDLVPEHFAKITHER